MNTLTIDQYNTVLGEMVLQADHISYPTMLTNIKAFVSTLDKASQCAILSYSDNVDYVINRNNYGEKLQNLETLVFLVVDEDIIDILDGRKHLQYFALKEY